MAVKSSSGIKLVVVESPTKAKTIRKFLGKDFIVESCMGHIRDLPQSAKDIPEKIKKQKWAQLGVNVDHKFEPIYCIPKDKTKVVKNLRDKVAEADEIFLATDEDREGESISWHLLEVLKPKVPIKRMVFNEITKEAIQKSLKETREIDFNLVKAQEARRILDRLVGYTISPLIWKKVAYGLSAGRVQSVAVRLIVEKELARIRFKKALYGGLTSQLEKENSILEVRLQFLSGKRLATGKDFDGETGKLLAHRDVLILQEKEANELAISLKNEPWVVGDIEKKPIHRKPAAPFITSTLQQEANRKLGMSSRETMQVAQKLYEQGFITYMRTDSTFLSNEAILAARNSIKNMYGTEYLPESPRLYDAKKAKGAQEAHEAIRPAGSSFILPDETGLSGPQFKLYDLIWKRTMASQMVDSRQSQTSVKVYVKDAEFSASGMLIEFPGFLRAYVEGHDDPEGNLQDREVRLPPLEVNERLKCHKLETTMHETKAPARYTEASLVQTMEKEGIGRPSTYAAVIGTIIDRGYVRREANALVPTFTAMVVSKLLSRYLPQYVDLDFTSAMEKSLDSIAEGNLDYEGYLNSIYHGPKGLKATVDEQGEKIDPEEARTIEMEGFDDCKFKVGRFGAYLSTLRDGVPISVSLPESESPAGITRDIVNQLIEQKINGADSLGKDPKTGQSIYVLTGRFGPYVQLGEVGDENAKPKRVSLPAGTDPLSVSLQMALDLLSLPKLLGTHPLSGKEIRVGLGRFGPYVVCDGDYRSIPKTESLFSISLDRALELLSVPKKGRGRASPLKEFGLHSQTGVSIQLMSGPYGPYLKSGKFNVSIPEDLKLENLTAALAEKLISDKIADKGVVLSPSKEKRTDEKSTKRKAMKKKKSAKKKLVKNPVSESGLKKISVGKSNQKKAVALGVTKVIGRKKLRKKS